MFENMKNIFILSLLSIILVSCSPRATSNLQMLDKQIYASTPPSAVIITEGDITDKKYNVIGKISVKLSKWTALSPDPTREDANNKLREEAAKKGANAVIFIRYSGPKITLTSWGVLEANGEAVRFEE
tara:strand:- start:331 stop:714 length:384 start_codon:yes stop_codon:yes gene_type:complete